MPIRMNLRPKHHPMKKIISILALVALTLPLSASAASQPFTDVYSHMESLIWMKEWGVFGGYDDGSFKPYNEINRAELAKVLVLGSGIEESEVNECAADATHDFSDVDDGQWYTDYIYCANAMGWITGDDGTTTARPGDPALLAETFKMVVEAHYGTPPAIYNDTYWYDPYINFMLDHGILAKEEGSIWSEFVYFGYLGLDYSNDSHFGFGSNYSDKVSRIDVSELIYRLRVMFVEDSAPGYGGYYNLYLSLDDYVEQYGAVIEEEDGNLSVTDSFFGFSMENIPLEDYDTNELSIFVRNPSSHVNGFKTEWYLLAPNEDSYLDDVTVLLEVEINDPDWMTAYTYNPDNYSKIDSEGYGFTFICNVYGATSVEELVDQFCVIDESQNLDADFVNFETMY